MEPTTTSPVGILTTNNDSEESVQRILRRAGTILFFQSILLLISSFSLLPLFFSSSSEEKGWFVLLFSPIILITIIAFGVLSFVGLRSSIKLLKSRIVNSVVIIVLITSFLCTAAFIVGVLDFVVPIILNINQSVTYNNNQKQEEDKKQKFFDERYKALSEQFKGPQKISAYSFGKLFVDSEEHSSTGKIILLGMVSDTTSNEAANYWNDKTNLLKDKYATIVLPDEETFKESYSCDGMYQDCIESHGGQSPDSEHFYAQVYVDGKLLNDDYTEEEQNIAKKGERLLWDMNVLSQNYNTLGLILKEQKKVLSSNVSDHVYLVLEGKDPVNITLNAFIVTSDDQRQKVEDYLKKNVEGRMVKVNIPSFDDVASANLGYNSDSGLNMVLNAQVYLDGKPLNELLKSI